MHGDIQILPKRILEDAVFDNPRELRDACLVGVEFEKRRSVAEDAHGEHRHAALRRNRVPSAELAKECNVARRERVDPRVETIRGSCCGPIADEREGETAQRASQACADRARADDD
jgi:hypothetical protein